VEVKRRTDMAADAVAIKLKRSKRRFLNTYPSVDTKVLAIALDEISKVYNSDVKNCNTMLNSELEWSGIAEICQGREREERK
jgi:hypothetical protein